jgi:hypothetical protein
MSNAASAKPRMDANRRKLRQTNRRFTQIYADDLLVRLCERAKRVIKSVNERDRGTEK